MIYYRTKDDLADYGFSFEQLANGEWRAYITAQPGYNGRDDSAHPTHRLSDGGRRYVCWNTPLFTEAQVRTVAAQWADATQRYILYGERF